MSIKIRFLGRFQELLGSSIEVESENDASLSNIVRQVAAKNKEGYDVIFDELGQFRQYVILLKNETRIETFDAEETMVASGDTIAVFLPISGG